MSHGGAPSAEVIPRVTPADGSSDRTRGFRMR
ncbi:hypothetical protein GPN2_13327 [Streptomyces murinus]